jgi:peptidoglycan/LPS O-acetylase OafA/YrhL
MLRETKYRGDIQVLRGIAVLAVVLFHANESYFPFGYLGVDVFFVISGFVITPLILRIFIDQSNGERIYNLKQFYKRRFYRLAPALAVTLVFSTVIVFLLGPIGDHERFALQGITTLLLIGNYGAYRYSGDYFSPNINPLLHTWSLSTEEQIYIFLPFALILILHNRKNPKKAIFKVFAVITLISSVLFFLPSFLQPVFNLATIEDPSQFSFYSPFHRIWQFTLGGLSYFVYTGDKDKTIKVSKLLSFASLLGLFLILFTPIPFHFGSSSILTACFAILVIKFNSLDVLPNVLAQKLAWVGDRSYSIYLVHLPLLYIAQYSPISQIGADENQIIQSMIAVAASLFIGSFIYSKIEIKYKRRGKSAVISIKTISVALILTFTLPLALFSTMYWGATNKYWSLNRNYVQPAVAWELDPECNPLSERNEPCVYGESEERRTVLLIGDSHAAQLSLAVAEAAKNVRWNAVIWTQAGCHIQFQASLKNKVSRECASYNLKILKWISESKPDLIIVSQFVLSDSSLLDMRKALTQLQVLVPKILLIENNPVFPNTSLDNPIIMFPNNPPKSVKESEMNLQHKMASDDLAIWARLEGISTLNFMTLFCKEGNCNRYARSKWLYWDDDHLSVTGAALTIPKFEAFLKQI